VDNQRILDAHKSSEHHRPHSKLIYIFSSYFGIDLLNPKYDMGREQLADFFSDVGTKAIGDFYKDYDKEIIQMTTTDLKIKMKETLDKVDKGEKVLVTRNGAIYQIIKVA
jgi:hypothetical protein